MKKEIQQYIVEFEKKADTFMEKTSPAMWFTWLFFIIILLNLLA